MNINFLKRLIYFFIFFLSIVFFNKTTIAHELWLEPKNFKFDNKKLIKIDIKIGQNFEGSAFGYYDPLKKSLYIENKNTKIDLKQRDGNFPAIQTLILESGFHILNYETNYETLKYESKEKFLDFLKEQRLQNKVEITEHDKLQTESYKRIAKVLLTDGKDSFFVQKPKLDFEIIALNSPYEQKNEFFKFQLFKKTKPLGNWEVTVFSKNDKNIFKDIVKTNPNGVGKLRLSDNRLYLLSAVSLEKANFKDKIKYKSNWLSAWASMTFKR